MMAEANNIMTSSPEQNLHELHDFFIQSDANQLHVELESRLKSLADDEASGLETFSSGRRIFLESAIWGAIALACYVATWIVAAGG